MALTGRDLEMALSPPPDCLVWPIEAWPEIDQRLWWAGLDPGDGLDPTYAADLAQSTISNARKGYGRWLAVLAAAGELDPAVPPASRVSRARAKLFAKALRARANANNSIHARFWELRSALRILQPDADFAWLTSWLGRLPIRLREVEAFDSRILAAWGHQLMQSALAHPQPMVRQTRYRNGLMIAIMAARATLAGPRGHAPGAAGDPGGRRRLAVIVQAPGCEDPAPGGIRRAGQPRRQHRSLHGGGAQGAAPGASARLVLGQPQWREAGRQGDRGRDPTRIGGAVRPRLRAASLPSFTGHNGRLRGPFQSRPCRQRAGNLRRGERRAL